MYLFSQRNNLNKPLFRLIGIFLLLLSINLAAEVVRVGLPSEGNPPYSYTDKNNPKGIYIELLKALFEDTLYKLEYVYLSSARIRTQFKHNQIDIECCPLGSWRQGEESYSVYTNILFTTEDVYVFPKDQQRTISSIEDETIATVAGYGYLHDNKFSRVDFNSEASILRVIANQRIPLGIVDRYIAYDHMKNHGVLISLGDVHEKAHRPIRLHKNKQHILPELNEAIKRLKASNRIETIFNRYGVENTPE